MTENKITIKDRAKLIKLGSSSYNYYMTTPLSELNSREDKLLKKELEKLYLLNEADINDEEDEDKEEESKLGFDTKAAIGAAAVAGGVSTGIVITNSNLSQHFNEWITSLKEYWSNKDVEEEVSTSVTTTEPTDKDPSNINNIPWYQRAYNNTTTTLSNAYEFSSKKLVDSFNGISGWVNNKLNEYTRSDEEARSLGDTSTTSNVITGTIIGAVVIIGIYAIWKIYKWFVRDDGTEKEEVEATSEAKYISNQVEEDVLSGKYLPITELGNPFSNKFNPMYNNTALAIIHESDALEEKADDVIKSSEGPKGFMINVAIKFSNNLLNNDPKFINHMNKKKPELIVDIQEWKDKAEGSSMEATQENKTINSNNMSLLNESDEMNINNDSDNTSEDILEKLEANTTNIEAKSLFEKIKNKISDIKNRFENSSNRVIRWIPNIIKLALGVLAVAAVYYGGQKYIFKNKEEDITSDDSNVTNDNIDNSTNDSDDIPSEEAVEAEVQEVAQEANNSNINYRFINSYLNNMSIISEMVEKISDDDNSKNVLDTIKGRGEELGDNIIERAKSISIDLLNDKDYITFAKKNKLTIVNDFKKALEKESK